MGNIVFKKYQNDFNKELNSWQLKEIDAGENGLEQFVVMKGSLLGDYLEFINSELDGIKVYLAMDNKNLIGFLCYSKPKTNHIHIEILGINPDYRGQGYARKMLISFKNLVSKHNETKLTLSVNKNNMAGIASFSKVATLCEEQKNTDYIDFIL